MKSLLSFALPLFLAVALVRAEDPAPLAALKVVDDARVAAFISNDHARLEAILSQDLHYAHSSGKVDTKESLMAGLESGALKYTGLEYDNRSFTFPAPTIALMTGRVHLQARTAAGGDIDTLMSFLAVYRDEGGQWRFLAWQSCKLPSPVPANAK